MKSAGRDRTELSLMLPCWPHWAPERTGIVRVIDSADAKALLADYPQVPHFAPGVNLLVLFDEGGTPLHLADSFTRLIALAADHGFVIARFEFVGRWQERRAAQVGDAGS
jgi:hypothetical protein